MKLIGRGRTAEIYSYSEDKIIKLFNKEFDTKYIKKEFDINKYIQNKFKFIPKAYEIIDYEDRYGIIFEKIKGMTLLNQFLNNPSKVQENIKKFINIQKKINSLIVDNNIQDYKNELQKNIEKNGKLDIKIKNKLLILLNNLETKNNLCHGDFHLDNAIINSNGIFIIDWINARKGNPLIDFARTYILIKFGSIPNSLSKKELLYVDILRKSILKEYMKNIDMKDLENFKKWSLIVSASRLSENLPIEEKKKLKLYIKKEIIKL